MTEDRAQLASLGQAMACPRPPGHTCPTIDKLKSVLRRLEWWEKNREEDKEVLHRLVMEAHSLLEQVRSDNTQMREAYWAMKRSKT
jgi:hypothetical protein